MINPKDSNIILYFSFISVEGYLPSVNNLTNNTPVVKKRGSKIDSKINSNIWFLKEKMK
jgi:hypothetical protein